jgi:transposase
MTNEARFLRADRDQTRWDFIDLEALLPSDHRARIVWAFVESLDLSALYDAIKSREGVAGRPPPDPAVVLALWLYAAIEGVWSARELDRLAERDLAYRWIAGGVALNYHGLSDFRVEHGEVFDRLLTESVTALIAEGTVSLAEVGIDGTKVRAHASRGSFKTGEQLDQIEAAVGRRLAALAAEIESDPEACDAQGRVHSVGCDDGSAQRLRTGGSDGRRSGPPLRQDTGKASRRHPLRHERRHRRAGRASGRAGDGLCAIAART